MILFIFSSLSSFGQSFMKKKHGDYLQNSNEKSANLFGRWLLADIIYVPMQISVCAI
jgi:hypothetical protein